MEEKLDEINKLERQIHNIEGKMKASGVKRKNYDIENVDRLEEAKEAQERLVEIDKKYNKMWMKALGIIIGVMGLLFTELSPYLGIIKNFGILLAIFIGSVIVAIIVYFSAKKIGEKEREQALALLEADYKQKLPDAKAKDDAEEERYEKDNNAALKKLKEKYTPELNGLKEKLSLAKKQFKEIQVISDRDLGSISKMIDLIRSRRADSIKECFKLLEEENERNRRQEEEKRRQEEERRRNSPGELTVFVTRNADGRYKVPKNAIYIDGIDQGFAVYPGKTIKLMPGIHSIYVKVQVYDHIYSSDSFQIQIEGGESSYALFTMVGSSHILFNAYGKEDKAGFEEPVRRYS